MILSPTSLPVPLPDLFEIREAETSDNEGLLALTRATPMAGGLSLRIDRDPDFFALTRLRGSTRVLVATRGAEIIGCVSLSTHDAYIRGKSEPVGYLADLKVHPRCRRNGVASGLLHALASFARASNVDLVVTVTPAGNNRVMRMLAGLPGLPAWESLGRFKVDQLLSTSFDPSKFRGVERASPEDLGPIEAMMCLTYRNLNFAPSHPDEAVAGYLAASEEASFRGWWVAREQGHPVAALFLADTRSARHLVLAEVTRPQRLALGLLRLAARPFGVGILPVPGGEVGQLHVRHLVHVPGHSAAVAPLLRAARAETRRAGASFLSVGLQESDPRRDLLRGFPRIPTTALAFATSLRSPGRLTSLARGPHSLDFSLV